MILEATAGSGTPLVIRVVEIVPVELRLVVIEVDIRHIVGVLVAGTVILLILIHCHWKQRFADQWSYILKLPVFNLVAVKKTPTLRVSK
ncbi:hypothetical protein D4R86_04580 [bacterium]|nr:MAG: hypothetical protein D4R86_04580 [bacterium]